MANYTLTQADDRTQLEERQEGGNQPHSQVFDGKVHYRTQLEEQLKGFKQWRTTH